MSVERGHSFFTGVTCGKPAGHAGKDHERRFSVYSVAGWSDDTVPDHPHAWGECICVEGGPVVCDPEPWRARTEAGL